MNANVHIRRERPDDVRTIGEIIDAAFAGMPYAAGDEAELVESLRNASALVVSLVAELDDTVVGQIAFSPARIASGVTGWFALGPVAVLPDHQGTGIGSKLVRAGLDAICDLGAAGCILTGNPDFYSRFGFEIAPRNTPPGEPSAFFMVKVLAGRRPDGPIRFHDAFESEA